MPMITTIKFNNLFFFCVITSYSIHYTKLYDEAMVAEKPEPKGAGPAMPDMGGMGGMM